MSKNTSERVLSILEAYSNPIRADILLYLKIYGRISLTDLARLIGKSKPTISKHIKILHNENIVKILKVRTVNTPGNIDPHYYELNMEIDHSLRGVDILNFLLKEAKNEQSHVNVKEILEKLMDTRIIHYQRLQRISNLTINYLVKMKSELLQNIDSKEKAYQILQDHTGHISFDFLNQKSVFEIINQNTGNFDEIVEKNKQDNQEVLPYVYIKLLLPIKRIMDISREDIWKIDGTLWPKREFVKI